MKKAIGPHQRAGRRRRVGKAAAIVVMLVATVLVSSWNIRYIPSPGKWDRPTIQDLVTARIEYELAGGPYGNAEILLERYQQYGDYITGIVNDPAQCGPIWVWNGKTKVLETPAEVSG